MNQVLPVASTALPSHPSRYSSIKPSIGLATSMSLPESRADRREMLDSQ